MGYPVEHPVAEHADGYDDGAGFIFPAGKVNQPEGQRPARIRQQAKEKILKLKF